MDNLFRYLKYFFVTLSLWCNSLAFASGPHSKVTPIGQQLNQIIATHYDSLAKAMNDLVKNGPTTAYLKRFSDEEKLLYKKLIKSLRRGKFKAHATKDALILSYTGGESVFELVDFLSNEYKVNGSAYHFYADASLSKNLEKAMEQFGDQTGTKVQKPKTTWIEKILFIEEAHAFIFVATIALLAIGSVVFAADTVVSAGRNDIANSLNPAVRLKIQELQAKFKDRADQCQSDLARINSGDRSEIEGNSSVKMVATLIDGLGAELTDHWFDFDGKKQIDYEALGCKAYDDHGDTGIQAGQMVGVIPGDWYGKVVKPLCDEQSRLNKCFEKIEQVMRDKDITINDVQKNSPAYSYEGLLDEYKTLSGAIKQ